MSSIERTPCMTDRCDESTRWHLIPIRDSEVMPSFEDMIQDIIKKFQIPYQLIAAYEGATGPIVESTLSEKNEA
jgi:hypothetical protein